MEDVDDVPKISNVAAKKKSVSFSRRAIIFESPFAKLADGQLLPNDLNRTISFSMFGTPMTETDKTFLVIGRELSWPRPTHCGRLFRFSSNRSFFLFSPVSLIRRIALYIYSHPAFESMILLTIIANAIYMSLNVDYSVAELTFLTIYTVEAVVKCIARGVVLHPYSYLHDQWNWLDLFVLLSSYAALAVHLTNAGSGGFNLQALRTFRLLRMVTVLPGLQAIVKALLLATRRLLGVLAFVLFFLVVFALFGLQLFQGDLRNKCVSTKVENSSAWQQHISNSNNWALDNFGNSMICGNISGAQMCPDGFACFQVASSENPLYGYLSFDDFLTSLIAVLIVVTGDYWEEEFRVVLSTNGPWSSLYFFVVVVFGAFYLMNLILSVVALSYTAQEDDGNDNETQLENDQDEDFDEGRVEKTTFSCEAVHDGTVDNSQTNDNTTLETSNKCTLALRKCGLKFGRSRQLIRSFVESNYFDAFITAMIVINTVAMAVVHHAMPAVWHSATDVINEICAVIFGIEALLKILALGQDYFLNRWNLLDFFVVIGSVVDAVATHVLHSATSLNTSSIRLLRLLRILKLAQSWRTMRLLLEIVFYTVTSLANLTVIMACVVFIFALIGLQLFSGTYTVQLFGDELPRWNFDDLFRSLMTIFRILCRDAVEPMVTCFRANGRATCLPVFLGTLFIGTFVVLNLFLALLLMAFSSDELKASSAEGEEAGSKPTGSENGRIFKKIAARLRAFFSLCNKPRKRRQFPSKPRSVEQPDAFASTNTEGQTRHAKCCRRFADCCAGLRQRVKAICEHKIFETAILVLIFASSISLCLHDIYLVEGSSLDVALSILDKVFLAMFTIEFLIKLIAYGFRNCFNNFWTILDFIVITTGFVDLGLAHGQSFNSNLVALRCLRCLRCLRPLRAISRWQGMRVAVNALIRTIPGIGNVLLVVVVFWLVFAIVGVQFFAGKFARCIDLDSGDRMPVPLVPNRTVCEAFPNGTNATRRWMNPAINFDNVFRAYLSLLQIATFESWTNIFEAGVDVPDQVNQQPSRERSFTFAIYFVVFIIFGSFFLLNLFIGVIVDSFNRLKKELEISPIEMLLTDSQRTYYSAVKKLGKRKSPPAAPPPKRKFLCFFYKLAVSPAFESAMAVIIVASCVAVSTEHFGQSVEYTLIQEHLNIVFTGMFAAEALIKIIGLRIHYFRDSWNIFDATLVVWSLATLKTENTVVKDLRMSALLRALRVMRVGRLVRLVRSLNSVRTLIFSLLSSLPALFNVGCLLALVIFIYSVSGMILFGRIRHQGAIDDVVNFETFVRSMLLLFRLSTLAGWDGILAAMSIQPEEVEKGGCDPDGWMSPATGSRVAALGGDCGNPIVAAVYLASFMVVSNFVLTNIFVAIILENLDAATETVQQKLQGQKVGVEIADTDIDSFFFVWAAFDPYGTQYIRLSNFGDLLSALDEPFHFKKPNDYVIAILDIPILKDQKGEEVVHCGDVLLALVHHRSVGLLATCRSRKSVSFDEKQNCAETQSEDGVLEMTSTSHAHLRLDCFEDVIQRLVLANELEQRVFGKWQATLVKNASRYILSTSERRQLDAKAAVIQRAWRKHYELRNYTI